MEGITVIKVGGQILGDEHKLQKTLASFSEIQGAKILVHGGGAEASDLAKRMGVEVKMVEGRRITDDEMIDIVTMVYAGRVNKNVVAKLQSLNVNGIGVSGADGNIILSDRRPVKTIDYGNVGDIKNVNGVALVNLLQSGFVPVFCALTHDGKGNMLNTNADTIASAISSELSKSFNVRLCYAFELKGVLADFENKDSVISKISELKFEKMKKDGSVNQGMIPKIFNALSASKSGVEEVFICQFDHLHEPEKGTQVC